ncbi:MAG: hypothetical protein WEC35_00385 [Nitrosopumilaceae archaeon]
MKVELEFNTEIDNEVEILTRVSQIVKTAKKLGFNIEEVEIEQDSKSDYNQKQ